MKQRQLALKIAASAALVLAAVGVQAQTVYRIVGPDGKVTFSDKPPAAAANVTARSASGKPLDTATQGGVALPFELRQVVARYPVTLYAGAGCVPCNAGRLMLQGRGIPYTEYTIATNEDVDALQRLSGDKSLPFLTIGGQKIKGYSEAEWTQFLNAANYPASSQLPSSYRFAEARPLVTAQRVAQPPATAPGQAAASDETREARRTGEEPSTPTETTAPSPTNPAGIKF
jgi:glutaredoxin